MKNRFRVLICIMLVAIMGLTGCRAILDGSIDNGSSDIDTSNTTIDADSSENDSTDTDISSDISSETESNSTSSNATSSKPKPSTSSKDESPSSTVSTEDISSGNDTDNETSDNNSADVESSESESISDGNSGGSTGGIKYIAFTFDDGPSSTYTRKIVDKLASYDGRGTFFVVGNRLTSTTGAAIQYAVNKGNEIGIHAYTHSYKYNNCSESIYQSELSKTADAIHKYLPNYNITLMRPVGGMITDSRLKSCPYAVINWNKDTNDWRYKNPSGNSGKINTIYNNTIKNVKNGDIILMHEIYKNSYEAFCKAVDKLYKDGYRFVTVTELIGKSNIKAGKKYTHG
ncbi:MAG: polysaccharide deacetylase family protein [Clostridia bacterium]|nr:polysaccharide deacetylase family protein [Clostridia bacterium]